MMNKTISIITLSDSRNGSPYSTYEVYGNNTLAVSTRDDMAYTPEIFSALILRNHLIPAMSYVCLLLLIGIPGNALVCYVYQQKWRKRRKTSTLFILALSWFDLINTLVSLPFEIALMKNFLNFDHPFLCKFSRYITFFMNASSSVVLLGIAVDRFIGIWCSVRTKPFGISRAKGTILLALFIALITCWPALVLFGSQTVMVSGIETKTCGIDNKFMGETLRKYPLIYGMYLMGSNVIVDSVFIIIYSLIGSKIYRRRRFGSSTQTVRAPTSFIFNKKRPSVYSCTSSTFYDEETTSLTSASRNKINFVARLVKEDGMNGSDTTLQRYGSLRRSFKSRCKFPSTHSVPEDEIVNVKLNETNNEKQKFLDVARPIRSASLPNCNMIVHKDKSNGSTKIRTWNFRSLPRTVSNVSHASSTENNAIGRYGRTYHTGKTTFMLFLVTLAYILTFVPYCIIYILRISNDNYYGTLSDVEKNFYQLFLRSYLLSSAINPIIYSFLNTRFRRECFSIIKNIICLVRIRCDRSKSQNK
ncbi:hypothetical protein FSP39_009211 [Pinctada imbricata]|uniref:G-protein coupled receptors family 1 profile domain-containing protein n=1 Tax=Pinctada imbricata TaxID=66713 RepID=A0AA89BUB6_PINIB|nr:hypothetical protein FSP39_009211 [Pinctada imbricata]